MRLFSSVWDRFALGTLCAVLGMHILWILLNHAPVAWDSASHTWISLQILSSIQHFNLHGVLTASNYYPIFIHTITALILGVTGAHIITAQYAAVLYFGLTLVAIYLYTGALFADKRVAFFTSLFFAFFPIVADQAHWLMLDVPLTGILFFTLYIFERSCVFTNRNATMWFFVSLACLIMTKWTGIFFLVFPILYAVIKQVKEKDFRQLGNQLKFIALGLAITLALCLPWYLTNFHSLIDQARISVQSDGGDPTRFFSLANFTDYLLLFENFQVTPVIALFSILSAIYLIIKREKQTLFVLGSILTGYLIFTIIGNKDPRYTLPLLPYASMLLAAAGVTHGKSKQLLGIPLGTLVTAFIVGYTTLLLFRPISFTKQITIPYLGGINVIDIQNELVRTYDPRDWNIDHIMQTLIETEGAGETTMIIGFEDEHFNPSTLQTYLKSRQLKGKLEDLSITTPDIYHMEDTYHADSFPDTQSIDSYLNRAKYVLLSPQSLGTQYLRNATALNQIRYRVLSDTLHSCIEFTSQVGKPGTTCYVDTDTVFHTGADVIVNTDPVTHGSHDIHGFAVVKCPWGCSFGLVKTIETQKPFTTTLIHAYTLPDGQKVNLYKLTHITL